MKLEYRHGDERYDDLLSSDVGRKVRGRLERTWTDELLQRTLTNKLEYRHGEEKRDMPTF